MRLNLDGTDTTVPNWATMSEVLDGAEPLIDPRRVVTSVDVDGRAVDPTDTARMGGWRLRGDEVITIRTATPEGFATERRGELAGHLHQIADLLSAAAGGFRDGNTADANLVLAEATRALLLVLQLDEHVTRLIAGESRCLPVAEVVQRVGPQLEAAERGQRWGEVATLLSEQLVPVLRLAQSAD